MCVSCVLIIIILLFSSEFIYFKVAERYDITDKPNHRSSHDEDIIRGGGIVFAFGIVFYLMVFGIHYTYFTIGLLLISVVSFLDDLKPISNKVRLLFHLAAVGMLFYQLEVYFLPVYLLVGIAVVAIGIINAINFMDGINGITGGYSFITVCSLLIINLSVHFTDNNLLITVGLSLLTFNFFNFRTKARCFAGDVGSIGIAFILLFLIGQLIIKTGNASYMLLLLIYGLDTVTTILLRFIRKENIFKAHRSHFYQYLANERKLGHVYVSILYCSIQLLLNVVFLSYIVFNPIYVCAYLLFTGSIFVVLRIRLEGVKRLFSP